MAAEEFCDALSANLLSGQRSQPICLLTSPQPRHFPFALSPELDQLHRPHLCF